MMYNEAPDVPAGRILNLPISRLNTLRRAVFKEILKIAEEHERFQEREAAESAKTGAAQWEVRIELGSHEDTEALAERLESEEIPVVRRHTFLLAGSANEDDARALAERLRGELPEGAKVEVEPGGGMVWEVAPRNPFTFFGGLGG